MRFPSQGECLLSRAAHRQHGAELRARPSRALVSWEIPSAPTRFSSQSGPSCFLCATRALRWKGGAHAAGENGSLGRHRGCVLLQRILVRRPHPAPRAVLRAVLRGGGGAAARALARRRARRSGKFTGGQHTCGTTCCCPAAGPPAPARRADDTPQRAHARLRALSADPPVRQALRGARRRPEPSPARCCPHAPADRAPWPAALLPGRADRSGAPPPPPRRPYRSRRAARRGWLLEGRSELDDEKGEPRTATVFWSLHSAARRGEVC